jgi:Skp family chaperone for outer membrane proteins
MEKQLFAPFHKKCRNISAEIARVIKSSGVPQQAVDFDILSYNTYIKKGADQKWKLIPLDNYDDIFVDKYLLNEQILITQEYNVAIHPTEKESDLKLNFGIASNESKSLLIATMKEGTIIPNREDIATDIFDAIQKKKNRMKFFIGICEDQLKNNIATFLEYYFKNNSTEGAPKIEVGRCLIPEKSVNDGVIAHYKRKEKEKNLVDGVNEGELIFEYRQAKRGMAGRDCLGNFIEAKEPIIKYEDKLRFDENTIRVEQEEDHELYYALKSGFVERDDGGMFKISNDLGVEAATFKGTGSIKPGEEKEVNLKIKESHHSKDAISTGVNIDVTKLEVEGTVGRNTKVNAEEVNVGTQTHRNSQIQAKDNATIHLHRGNLKTKNAKIEILETGIIEAETVEIGKVIGGEIYAREVTIEVLHSNARITASDKIEIKFIEGEGNKLIIDPSKVPSLHEKQDSLNDEYKKLKPKLKIMQTKYMSKSQSFQSKAGLMKKLQDKLKEDKKFKRQSDVNDLMKMKQFQQSAKEVAALKEEFETADKHYKEIEEELHKINDAIFHAQVIHHSTWNGTNEVKFVDHEQDEEYRVAPKTSQKTVKLEKLGDGLGKIIIE